MPSWMYDGSSLSEKGVLAASAVHSGAAKVGALPLNNRDTRHQLCCRYEVGVPALQHSTAAGGAAVGCTA